MSGFDPKARTQCDSLPSSPEAWNAYPAIAEQAFRRGYTHGLAAAVESLDGGATADDIERYLYGKAWDWRWGEMKHSTPPPNPVKTSRRRGKSRRSTPNNSPTTCLRK